MFVTSDNFSLSIDRFFCCGCLPSFPEEQRKELDHHFAEIRKKADGDLDQVLNCLEESKLHNGRERGLPI